MSQERGWENENGNTHPMEAHNNAMNAGTHTLLNQLGDIEQLMKDVEFEKA